MIPDIIDPEVLIVQFENQGGDWVVKIPNAYKDGSGFIASVDENLSLQFQPVMLSSFLGKESRPGIACIPLHFVEEEPEKKTKKKKGTQNENSPPTP